MADYTLIRILQDDYGRLNLYKAEADFNAECAVISKTVKDWEDTTMTPSSDIDSDLNTKLAALCPNNFTQSFSEQFTNVQDTKVTLTNHTMPDPATTADSVFHLSYRVRDNGGILYEYNKTDGGSTSWYVDAADQQIIRFYSHARGATIYVEKL